MRRIAKNGWAGWLSWLCLVALGFTIGCSDDGFRGPPDHGDDRDVDVDVDVDPDVDVDADPDVDVDLPPPPLTVHVERVEPTIVIWEPYRTVEDTVVLGPAEGATVALQDPRGSVIEAVADAEGFAIFEDVDWTLGEYAVTAYLPGHTIYSRVGVEGPPADDQLDIRLAAYSDEDPKVRVAGQALGRDRQYRLFVTSLAGGVYAEPSGAGSDFFALDTRAGEALSLVASERGPGLDSHYRDPCDRWELKQTFYRWAIVSSDALSEDAIVHIDFDDDAIDSSRLSSAFELPERSYSPLRQACDADQCASGGCPSAWGYVTMFGDAQLNGPIGWATSMSQAGGRVEYRAEYAALDGDGPTVFLSATAGGGYRSLAWGDAPPTGPAPRLLDVPEWRPSRFAQGLDETVEWRTHEPDAQTYVTLYTEGRIPWVIAVPDGAETAAIPVAPSSVDLGALFVNQANIEISHIRTDERFDYTSWGPMRPLDIGVETAGTPITIAVSIDDRANQTYAAEDRLAWKAPIRHGIDFDGNDTVDIDEANRVELDLDWSGPYPLLYDDGPVSDGGHEPEGATAGDHVWGVVVETESPGVTLQGNYGFVWGHDREGNPNGGIWIAGGPIHEVTIPAGVTEPIVLDTHVIPAFGDVNLRLEVDTAALDPDWVAAWGIEEVQSVGLRTSALSWKGVWLRDDGLAGDQTDDDGIYTFVLSEQIGAENGRPHEGLLNEDDVVEWSLRVNNQSYAFGPDDRESSLSLTDGIWVGDDCGHEGVSACLDATADCTPCGLHRTEAHISRPS